MMDTMTTNKTINIEDLSTEIIVNIFRDGMRDAADDENEPLTDPKSDQRPDNTEFIMTSFPQTRVFYPLIIIDEFDDSDERVDAQVDFFRHSYALRITIYAESNTHLYHIRDQVRHFIESNYVANMDAGFHETSIQSSTAATWEVNAEVQKWEMIVSGMVFTKT